MTTVDSILKRIIQKCLTHPSISTSSRSLTSQSHPPQPVANIALPDAPSLQPALMAAGVHPEISLEMDQAFQKRAADLRALCHQAITHLCSNQYSSEQKVVPMFTELYLRQLVTWREEVVTLYLKYSAAGDKTQSSASAPKFNHEYVPLLEHFFNENPFPTHADKAFLAKKSSMTYRQIHVWFQNRRNRTKREGKVLRRKPMSEGITLPLSPLLQSMEKFIVPEEQRGNALSLSTSSLAPSYEDDLEASPITANALDSPAPLHAFPSSYPPLCSYDPFPSRSGKTSFGVPEWSRTPMQTSVRRPAVDFDWLISQFSRMNVVDDSTCGKADSFAAVAAITVRPLSAPHPALIRGAVTHISGTSVSLPSVPATASRRHVFNTPSPQSNPITLVPTSETPIRQKTPRRKVAPLPRRIPHGNPISRQDITLVISEASVTPSSPSSPSRSPSSGSDNSSQSRLFSSVSSTSTSSSSSSILAPPSSSPSPPTQLPSPLVSSSVVDLFGDALQGTPSPVQLDFNSRFSGNSRFQKPPTIDLSFNALPVANLVRAPS